MLLTLTNSSISFATSTVSGTSLAGGSNASTTYDTGTASITVNGVLTSVSYGSGSSTGSIASALASALLRLMKAKAMPNMISPQARMLAGDSTPAVAMMVEVVISML